MRLIDVHRFGNWRLFFDDEDASGTVRFHNKTTRSAIVDKRLTQVLPRFASKALA